MGINSSYINLYPRYRLNLEEATMTIHAFALVPFPNIPAFTILTLSIHCLCPTEL